uniref:Saposin B-type domain-containing protein n=1 Tax=Panagrolaimus superbus TaxID=310955 RepID=A0A914Z7Y4_9BILA
MSSLKVAFVIVIFMLSFDCCNGIAIISSNGHKNQDDVMPCYVCEKGVSMTRDDIFASFTDIKAGMVNYCLSIYSQYKNNCLYIVNNYLADIYTKAHVTRYTAEAICVNEGLCSDKNHHLKIDKN